jgi:hypothetical protein
VLAAPQALEARLAATVAPRVLAALQAVAVRLVATVASRVAVAIRAAAFPARGTASANRDRARAHAISATRNRSATRKLVKTSTNARLRTAAATRSPAASTSKVDARARRAPPAIRAPARPSASRSPAPARRIPAARASRSRSTGTMLQHWRAAARCPSPTFRRRLISRALTPARRRRSAWRRAMRAERQACFTTDFRMGAISR